jgi:hypothetical protein
MAREWRDAPDEVDPTVLILGGFLTSPPLYVPMRRRLLERGAAGVVVAPVWLPDWLIAAQRGLGPILTRSARALLDACELAAGSARGGGAPLLVVGHSAGGLTARLLTSPEPFAGRRLGVAHRIAAIVTLGTPHRVTPTGIAGRRLASVATDFAERVVPGPAFAPTTGYLAVASQAVIGHATRDRRARLAYGLYRSFDADLVLDDVHRADGVPGDGLVPVRTAGLAGVETIVLDGIAHGQTRPGPWYGSDEALDVWWPRAVEVWRAALRARLEASVV